MSASRQGHTQWLTVPGADLDLADVDPGDLDPHAVSGLFKSYIRECK